MAIYRMIMTNGQFVSMDITDADLTVLKQMIGKVGVWENNKNIYNTAEISSLRYGVITEETK